MQKKKKKQKTNKKNNKTKSKTCFVPLISVISRTQKEKKKMKI